MKICIFFAIVSIVGSAGVERFTGLQAIASAMVTCVALICLAYVAVKGESEL